MRDTILNIAKQCGENIEPSPCYEDELEKMAIEDNMRLWEKELRVRNLRVGI